MRLVLYLLASLCLARAAGAVAVARWVIVPVGLESGLAGVWELAVGSWVALEVAVAVGLGLAARNPLRNRAAVLLSAAVIAGRLAIDVWGALRFSPDLAMVCLLDLVLHLALFSLWLRAIPSLVQAPGWNE